MLGTRQSATESPSWACFPGADPHKIPIDPNGNLTSKTEGTDSWGYTWNAENKLIRVQKNGAEMARFAYDPRGRRVERVASGITTSYVYDGLDRLRQSAAASVLNYVVGPGLDEVLGIDDGTALSFTHADGLGSVVTTTTMGGAVGALTDYDAWGRIQGGTPGTLAFTGREWDPETTLYYYRSRYYDATAARFISEDPIGLEGGINFYSYVNNRPASRIDPLGLLAENYCNTFSIEEGAGLCCKSGTPVLCTKASWWFAQSPEQRKCITEHEEVHAMRMANRCNGCSDKDGCTVIRYRTAKEHGQEECIARLTEYLCYRDSTPPFARGHRGNWAKWKDARSKDMDFCTRNNFFF